MRLHVRALFTLDRDGQLLALNESSGGPAPRFFLGRTLQGTAWWIRRYVGADLAEELRVLCEAEPTPARLEADPASDHHFVAALARKGPVTRVWSGPAFRCPPDLVPDGTAIRVTSANAAVLSPYLEEWRVDVDGGVPMAATLHHGRAVSVCCSVRVTDGAHEAGVETHPDFRGRGHASTAVAGWATAVRELGCLPLYSTSWENERSRKLASRLGLVQFGSDLHIT